MQIHISKCVHNQFCYFILYLPWAASPSSSFCVSSYDDSIRLEKMWEVWRKSSFFGGGCGGDLFIEITTIRIRKVHSQGGWALHMPVSKSRLFDTRWGADTFHFPSLLDHLLRQFLVFLHFCSLCKSLRNWKIEYGFDWCPSIYPSIAGLNWLAR